MTKRNIFIVLLIMLALSIVTVYNTFAYNEENIELEKSNSDYNLTYTTLSNNKQAISIDKHEEKYIDLLLTNTYSANVRYGTYYYSTNKKSLPEELKISLSDYSEDSLENVIKPNKTAVVSLKITNNSDEMIDLVVGALIGYENGRIEDLLTDGLILVK